VIYTRLGSTGTKVSRICLGTMTYGSKKWRDWVLEEKESLPFFERALARGINFFDMADVYSRGVSEEIVGRAMRTLNVARESVVIATKVAMPMGDGPNDKGLSRKRILASIDASLKRLQMDYVDLYQIHRFDYETPIQETLHTLNDVVQAGKARYIGASSMYAWQFARMRHTQRGARLGAVRHHAGPLQPHVSRGRA
jgi:aryl-alcohol dehydrogenase (NADP+)